MQHPTVTLAITARPALSAADAVSAIADWTDLAERKRRELTSSVQVLSRWLRKPLRDIPITPDFLRRHVLDTPPGRFGVGLGRMRNVKHGLRAVLRRLEITTQDSGQIAPAWRDIIAMHALRKQESIVAFAKFCSARDLCPVDVRADTIDGFERWLDASTLCRRPRNTTNRLRGVWRQLAKVDPALTSPPSKRNGGVNDFILPLEAFPATFRDSLMQFGEHLAGRTRTVVLVDDEAPLASHRPLRPSTIEGRLGHVRWAASALVASGIPIDQITDLCCLVTPLSRGGAILDVVAAKYDGAPSACANHIGDVLRIIARHHAHLSPREVQQITQWARALRLTYTGMTPKNQRTVREVLSPETEQKLYRLPDALFESANRLLETAPETASRLARNGLAVQLLLHTHMRLANLIGLKIAGHLHQVGLGAAGEMWITVPAGEVKNRIALSYPLENETRDRIRLWIDQYRPHLATAGSPFLFPGTFSIDSSMTPQAMRDAVKAVTRDYLGVVITPHQFRHIAAHILLTENPGEYGLVSRCMGHTTIETAFRSYSGLEGEEARRHYDNVLRERSRLLAPQPKRRSSR